MMRNNQDVINQVAQITLRNNAVKKVEMSIYHGTKNFVVQLADISYEDTIKEIGRQKEVSFLYFSHVSHEIKNPMY